jgi:uncharacterized phage protein (TIGR02220 family)
MPARGVFRGLYSVLFDDPDFRRLPTSARFLLVTLRLCRDAGPSAIFEYSGELLMRQTGLSPRALETSFQALEAGSWIVREYPIVWVRNGLRYDPLLRLADPKHKRGVIRWVNTLPRLKIVLSFCDYYELPRPFEGPWETSLKEKEKEKEYGKGKEVDSLSGSRDREPDHASRTVGAQPLRQQARDILAFLNQQAHKSFRDSDPNLKLIEARLASGMTPANLRGIVARKVRTWSRDPKMAQFLRPATLFSATNAEQYLGERDPDA